MSDEREPRPRPDETRPLPFGGEDDATRIQGPASPEGRPRSGDAWVFDRTEESPQPPQRDATSIMPPAGGGWPPAGAGAWAGRAEVPPRRSDEYAEPEWAAGPPGEQRGRWWMPILIGIIALILLALLGWGLWLIIQAQSKNPAPAPVPSVSAPAPASNPPSTQPTTTPPTTQPTTTPAEVTIPALRGLSQQDAQRALSRRGLSSRLRYVASTSASPGTVIDSDPSEGQKVPPDTTVTLIIAAAPTTPPTTPPTSAGVIIVPGH